MEKSKKVARTSSYLWFGFVTNVLVTILTVVLSLLLFGGIYVLIWIFSGQEVANNFMNFISGNYYSIELAPTYFPILLILFYVATLVIYYFVARKEFAGVFKNFNKKYEGFDLKKAFNFALGFVAVYSASKLVENLLETQSADMYGLVAGIAAVLLAVVVAFFAYKAGAKRVSK